ncbi:MAG: Gfo/Idh/MocA family oxidoreductase [Lentisphaerae bacterium]|nr:Gfo/Idh/MocA family oxidoreductase [Lentisphaerota bacterium]
MLKIAIIGLDTSHSIAFPRLMQAPDCPEAERVPDLKAVTCLRFETPFQNKEGLDKRQAELETWGVKVTENFDEAISDCDAIMMEINDGAYHLEYFKKVAALGKPVFLDKPLAGSLADGRAILKLMKKHNTRVWSGSSLPFCENFEKTVASFSEIQRGHAYGALGNAPAGDSLIWYGVHTFEMLQSIMGPNPLFVRAVETKSAITTVVEYDNGREGIVETIRGSWFYGGRIQGMAQGQPKMEPFTCDATFAYRDILREIKAFFLGGPAPVGMETTFEGLAMMTAARKSIETGKRVAVPKLSKG